MSTDLTLGIYERVHVLYFSYFAYQFSCINLPLHVCVCVDMCVCNLAFIIYDEIKFLKGKCYESALSGLML